jgi:methionyl-tRNA formyltransferase
VSLRALVQAGHDVRVVVTATDKRRGRQQAPSPTPVKEAALSMGLAVSHRVEEATAAGAELGIVVAFGRIIKPDILARLGMVNVHFSLLPRWRGAAPVERAILAGDAVTGVCLMEVEEGLDTGGVYRRVEVAIGEGETARALTSRLAVIGAQLLVGALDEGLGAARPQSGEATYAAKIDPAELQLDFTRPASELMRVVLVGRAWTIWRGRRLIVLEAHSEDVPGAGPAPSPGTLLPDAAVATADGVLRLVTVQPEGRAALSAKDWVRGARPAALERLGGEGRPE